VILTAEEGKPLAKSRGEVLYGAGFVEWHAEEGKSVYGEVIPTNVQAAPSWSCADLCRYRLVLPWNLRPP